MTEVPGLALVEVAGVRSGTLDGVDLADVRITMGDIMYARHCVRGIKRWFADRDMDWRPLLRGGVPAVDFLWTQDAMAISVVRARLSRE